MRKKSARSTPNTECGVAKSKAEKGKKAKAGQAPTPISMAESPGPIVAPELLERIVTILEGARGRVVRAVNSEMVLAYWHIGREIVEHLQAGAKRAEYGEQLLDSLSKSLGARFGRGFSVTNLKYFRLFYQAFADREPKIRHGTRDELATQQIGHEPVSSPTRTWGRWTDTSVSSTISAGVTMTIQQLA